MRTRSLRPAAAALAAMLALSGCAGLTPQEQRMMTGTGMGAAGGAVALAVNVAAAAVLLPHRTGDANVRAVWLFSRNDAVGNLAVVVAAGLVWWTGTPWPDLAVAVVIAGLFLQSVWSIVRDALGDLRGAAHVRRGSRPAEPSRAGRP